MLDEMSILQTTRGNIVGHGSIKMPKISVQGRIYSPPMLYCIIIERKQDDGTPADWDGGRYVATCINLKMDGYGATVSESLRDMNNNVQEYVSMLLEHYGCSYAGLINVFKQDYTDPHTNFLWDRYKILARLYPLEREPQRNIGKHRKQIFVNGSAPIKGRLRGLQCFRPVRCMSEA